MVDEQVVEFGAHSKELIRQLGLVAPRRPEGEDLPFPADLSRCSDDEIGQLLTYWASMSAYANQKVSILEGALIRAKCEHDQEYDLRLYSCNKASVAERKITVLASRKVRALKVRVATIEADLKVLKGILIGYDLKNSAVSREITRRNNERALRDG